MRYRLLGPLQVVDGEVPVDVGPRKQRAVLAALLVAQGRVVSTLEGGYALDVLGSCALAHVTALDNPYSEF